jgi:hypothetical protein
VRFSGKTTRNSRIKNDALARFPCAVVHRIAGAGFVKLWYGTSLICRAIAPNGLTKLTRIELKIALSGG